MAEIDLIPASYRRERQLRERLRWFAAATAVVLLTTVALRIGLSVLIGIHEPTLARLKASQATVARERTRIDALRAARERTEQRVRVLEALRGGDVAAPIAQALERSMNEGVWLQNLKFARTGEFVDVKPAAAGARPNAAAAGTLVTTATIPGAALLALAPDDGKSGPSDKAWRAAQSIEVSGRSTDHAALADFLRLLGEQSTVADVRLLNTATRASPGGEIVEFTAIASLHAGQGPGR